MTPEIDVFSFDEPVVASKANVAYRPALQSQRIQKSFWEMPVTLSDNVGQ